MFLFPNKGKENRYNNTITLDKYILARLLYQYKFLGYSPIVSVLGEAKHPSVRSLINLSSFQSKHFLSTKREKNAATIIPTKTYKKKE